MTPLNIRTLAAVLGVAALAAACDENAWDTGTGPGFGRDSEHPRVAIESPDSGRTFAVGDSLRVEVAVTDDSGVAQVEIAGFSLRGSALLGTQRKVDRFETKVVDLTAEERRVRRASVVRDLLATADTVPEDSVYLVATARDGAGNVRADTTIVSLGGSRVRILAPVPEKRVTAGATLDASVLSIDRRYPIRMVRVTLRRALDAEPFATAADTLAAPSDSSVSSLALSVPATYSGPLYVQAEALNAANVASVSPTVTVQVGAPAVDAVLPVVQFGVEAPARAEPWDTVRVRVSATDNGDRLSRIGATVVARHAATGAVVARFSRADSTGATEGVFRFLLRDLGVPARVDSTFTLQLEVTGFAEDTARTPNCAAAISPARGQSLPCQTEAAVPAARGGAVVAGTPGALARVVAVRGRTAASEEAGSRFADLVADSVHRRVFVSNFARNRVEILPYDSGDLAGTVSVGSEPWGLAVGVRRDTLYVANSGGTNISVVPLGPGTPTELYRIRTPDVRLWGLDFDMKVDSIDEVTEYDYSDRPQFLAQVADGQLMYSTKPTATRADGTVRIIDFDKDQTNEFGRVSEVLVNYAEEVEGKAVAVNALDARMSVNRVLRVCPRRLRPEQLDPPCVHGSVSGVALAIQRLREAGLTDTRIDILRDVASIGLTDTTFVAVSRDHSTVAFGEGATTPSPGRIFLYRSLPDTLLGSTTETNDLVGNAAERVIGLGLNGDGTFGVARGDDVYFYETDLRLQGVVPSGSPSGGTALHPLNANYPVDDGRRRAFTSGVDAEGRPFIDVVDTYTFRLVRRLYIRDAVVGTLVAMPVGADDPLAGRATVRLFGITAAGVLQLDVTRDDLR